MLSKHEVTNMFTTPTALRSMTGVADAGKKYPQKFRIVCSAGEPLNPEVIRWFREQYGITVLDYYGLTESYPLCGNFPTVEVREGSMGLPMPGWEVAILDEDEKPLPVGERGEICLKARSNPHYPIGYWNRDEDTEEVFGGEWFHTKDAAAARRGRLRLVRRPRRRRDHLRRLPDRAVRGGVGVRGAPGRAGGGGGGVTRPQARRHREGVHRARPRATRQPTRPADEIKKFVRERHSAYAYPREIEFVDDLPKTLTGKIRRIELREAEREKKSSEGSDAERRRRRAARRSPRPVTGRAKWKPWARWQLIARSTDACSACSTPSATVSRPSDEASRITASTIARSSLSSSGRRRTTCRSSACRPAAAA